ncbi:antibiotic biosynthesis monooxygenase [Deinococcus sp.]|uniref:antibiotic biosynthesis monooxygenase n=1 Tax=Deinococcus sp. TaxID=47478 RepID=UPI003C7ACFDA
MTGASGPSTRDPVTLVVRRRVLPGQEAAFETLVGGIQSTLARWPGHLGTGVVRPVPGQHEYTMVVRFGDAANAASWEDSPERAKWIARVAPLLGGEAEMEQQPGLEFWFTPPGSPSLAQPRRWKMMVVTLLALYPTSLLIALLVGPALAHLPLPLRSFLQVLLIVPLMTYAVMPVATRGFRRWLRP